MSIIVEHQRRRQIRSLDTTTLSAACIVLLMFLGANLAQAVDPATDSTLNDSGRVELVVGDLVPVFFVAKTLSGKYFHLRDQCGPPRSRQRIARRVARPVVLSFFATWCQPCLLEIPLLDSLSGEWEDEVGFFLINVGQSRQTVENFLHSTNTRMTVLLDRYSKTSLQYAGSPPRLPTLVVVDPEGRVAYFQSGYKKGFEKTVDEILDRLVGSPGR